MAASSDGGCIEGAMTKMLVFKRLAAAAVAVGALMIGALIAADTAFAAFGQSTPWQLGLQDSATPVMDYITWFHNYLLFWISAISAFVLILLIIIIVRFNARANPAPSRVTHNTLLEAAWTEVPNEILLLIGWPPFQLLL